MTTLSLISRADFFKLHTAEGVWVGPGLGHFRTAEDARDWAAANGYAMAETAPVTFEQDDARGDYVSYSVMNAPAIRDIPADADWEMTVRGADEAALTLRDGPWSGLSFTRDFSAAPCTGRPKALGDIFAVLFDADLISDRQSDMAEEQEARRNLA